MLIEERVEFQGDPTIIWGRLSDISRIPEFWHGTKSLQVLGRDTTTLVDGGEGTGKQSVRARAKFAFGGSGEVVITADASTMTLTSDYVSGPFKGVQVVRVAGNAIEAKWDVNFTGLFKLTSSWTGGHFKTGTHHALERLCGKEEAPSQKVVQP
jgi:hypothetical protein